ncbi:MAG: 30S ribosomal protein S17 [Candidatus Hodgkinia cicadicola]
MKVLKPLTLVILVTRLRKHSKYGKYVKVRKTYFVHAKYGLPPVGRVIKFKPCAPLSALKKWSAEKF